MNFFQFQFRHRPPWAGLWAQKKVQSFGIITTGASFAVANGGYFKNWRIDWYAGYPWISCLCCGGFLLRITSSGSLWDFCGTAALLNYYLQQNMCF